MEVFVDRELKNMAQRLKDYRFAWVAELRNFMENGGVPNQPSGEDCSLEQLLPIVYAELRALAGRYVGQEGAHTLQPTALVHEAYVKIANGQNARWGGKEHFMAIAAIAMRQVLVDHARRKAADKRGGGMPRADVSIEGLDGGSTSRELRVMELDELLEKLATLDNRSARVAEMRLFGGMQHEQIAAVLGISRTRATADWQFARAWLASEIREGQV